jgi:hypothetical protein
MAEFGDAIRTLVDSGSNGQHTFRWSSHQATLAGSFPPLPIPSASLMPHIEDSVRELLHVSIGEVMVGAWSKLQALHEFRGTSGGHGEVSLVDHSIDASYRPTLSVTIAPPPPMPWSLEFELKLTIDIGAVTLGIGGGRIRRVSPCDFQIHVALFWKDHEIVEPVHTKRMALPEVDLGKGIVIP